MKHFGLTLNLKNDPAIIEEYKAYHKDAWPETLAGLKAVGITKMNIYLLGRQLFMAMETVDTFDIKRDFPRYLEQHPKCREWDELMRTFQEPVEGAQAGEWWAQMEIVFEL
ncbi:L-rhamnose mutarotase [Candidatus Poribacteria bacterium]|nr:MAG: L-rhamnose mutarotase [Candidatus Poribacteria bacterium]